jgi:uncharacterized protein with FMN-binding domain
MIVATCIFVIGSAEIHGKFFCAVLNDFMDRYSIGCHPLKFNGNNGRSTCYGHKKRYLGGMWIYFYREGGSMVRKLLILLIVLVVSIAGVSTWRMIRYKQRISSLAIPQFSITDVQNGTYEGSYDLDLVKASIRVTVHDKKISDIRLLQHKTDKGKKAEVILNEVMNRQSLQVDMVTGATASSKTILLAIADALRKGLK